MSLNKAIEHGKEHRKQYGTQGDYGKVVSKRCRNHGGCDWCECNRTYKYRKAIEKAEYKEENQSEETRIISQNRKTSL